MKKVKCENNHYFDLEKYDVCPVCGANVQIEKEPVQSEIVTDSRLRRWPFPPFSTKRGDKDKR